MDLAKHPFFEATDPDKSRLVRVSKPFPDWANPFTDNNVVIRAAAIPGEVPHSKSYVARELLLGGISHGFITQQTIIDEATSGNTGEGLGKACKATGLRCRLIMPAGTVPGKLDALRVMGSGVEVVLHSDPNETTVERARREGAGEGHFNPDQYANLLNPLAHKKYLGPQLFGRAGDISLLVDAAGTMGTSMGLQQYVNEKGYRTRVLPVVLEENEEVPGARPFSKIERDVKLPWRELFKKEDIESGKRHASFLLAYYTWRFLPQTLGPSFGLAYQGALRWIQKQKLAGTLDDYRTAQGVQVVILAADGHMPYLNLFIGETQSTERHTYEAPDLLKLAL